MKRENVQQELVAVMDLVSKAADHKGVVDPDKLIELLADHYVSSVLFNELELPVADQEKAVAYPANTSVYYVHRFDTDPSKLAMSVHPGSFSFKYPTVTINGTDFYKIQDKWWQLAFLGSDDEGIFASFWRTEGTYVPF